MYQANLRQGTFATQEPGEVAGSTKKMYRQKGTGNARAGSRRSGIRRGGGHIFAKRPRDFGLPPAAQGAATGHAHGGGLEDRRQSDHADRRVEVRRAEDEEMAAILKALKCDGEKTCWWPRPATTPTCTRVPATFAGVSCFAGRGVECLDRAEAAAVADDQGGARRIENAGARKRRRGKAGQAPHEEAGRRQSKNNEEG